MKTIIKKSPRPSSRRSFRGCPLRVSILSSSGASASWFSASGQWQPDRSSDRKIIGSEWLGQNFTGAKYFTRAFGRGANGYDAANSSGSNLGRLRKADGCSERSRRCLPDRERPRCRALVPGDAVTASGSGLDPTSAEECCCKRPASPRNAASRGRGESRDRATAGAQFGILGEAGVNVSSSTSRSTSSPRNRFAHSQDSGRRDL